MFISSELLVSITLSSFVTLYLPVSEIANELPELFSVYKNYIILYTFLKSRCTLCFVLIGSCFSELHVHLCCFHNVWPEGVSCCFTRNTTCLHVYIIRVIGF